MSESGTGRTESAFSCGLAGLGKFLGMGKKDAGFFPAPGLNSYRIERDGGHTRIHLRVQEDGAGLLFVDVSDTVHLSGTAAFMAWLILEKIPEQKALKILLSEYSGINLKEIREHYRGIQKVLDKLTDPRTACRTCSAGLCEKDLFSGEVKSPYKVDIALSYKCNNSCSHCYNDEKRLNIKSLCTDDWFRVLDRLHDAGVPHLIFTGGEPTLFSALPRLVEYAEKKGHICGINTNGRRLKDRMLVRDLVSAGLDHVQVTLLSHSRNLHNEMVGKDAFDESIAGIENSLAEDLHVITNTTLTRKSSPGIMETVKFIHSLGISTFAMNAMIHSGRGKSHPDALDMNHLASILVQVKEAASELGMRFLWFTVTRYCEMSPLELELGAKRCNAAEYSMCIEPDGSVLPCQSYYHSAGNILRDPWDSFWESDLFKGFRDRKRGGGAEISKKCYKCIDFSVCGGGCRLEIEACGRSASEE